MGAFHNYLKAMGAAILEDTDVRPNLGDGLQVVATLVAIRESIDRGTVVSVPEVLERFAVAVPA